MYGLLIYDHDWADEFNVTGFCLLNEEEFDKFLQFKKDHPRFFNKEFSWYFGSNEEYEEERLYDSNHLTAISITKDEYDTLVKLFDLNYSKQFGKFPNLMDDINEYESNYFEGEI